MAFSIGRAGLTLTLPEPLNWQNSGGGTVTLTGTFLVSGSVTDYFKGAGGGFNVRGSADGNLYVFNGGNVSDLARFYLQPASYYIGAATFEQGSPLQPVVGRQLAQNDVVNWRLSNGLVRVTP